MMESCEMEGGTKGWKEDIRLPDLGGIFAPIPTPFRENETIAYDELRENLLRWNKVMVFRGYVVAGSNGEYVYMTPEERVEVVKTVKQLTPPDKLIIAGSGCESTHETIEMTKKMAKVGADVVLVSTPCYYKGKITEEALCAHYTKVADESPVAVLLYNVPVNTGIELSTEVVLKLHNHPNIIGLKESGGDISKIVTIVSKTKESGFQVLAGSASILYPALAVECVGGICALATAIGQDVCDLYKLFNEGEHGQAKVLQQRLAEPNRVTRRFGVSGWKSAMEWFGFYGGPTRSPLPPLSSTDVKTIRKSFSDNGFLENQ